MQNLKLQKHSCSNTSNDNRITSPTYQGSTYRGDDGARRTSRHTPKETPMNRIIYIVGLIVVIAVILSFLGLR
jgi:hypothetical protein